jgi:hypothetical protein
VRKLLFMLFILVIAAAGALWLSSELRGKAIVYMKDMGMEDLLHETGMEEVFKEMDANDSSVTLYKWQDKNGVWQYTQYKPANGIEYDRVEARSDVNLLPSIEQKKTKEK